MSEQRVCKNHCGHDKRWVVGGVCRHMPVVIYPTDEAEECGHRCQPDEVGDAPAEPHFVTCPVCKGSGQGRGDSDRCGYCGGDGSVPESAARVIVAVPDDYCAKMGDCRLCPNPNGNCTCTHHAYTAPPVPQSEVQHPYEPNKYALQGFCKCGLHRDAPIHQAPPHEFIPAEGNMPFCDECGAIEDVHQPQVDADALCEFAQCPFGLKPIHRISDHPAYQAPPAPAAESTQIVVFILKLIEIDANFSLKWDCHTKRWQLEIGWLGVDVNDKSLTVVLELAVNEAKTRSEKFKESLHG